jgi:hypothetical protein
VPTKSESADLLLKQYARRREPMLRQARARFQERFPSETTEQVPAVYRGKRNAPYRMVMSYSTMAAALVLEGAIVEPMFADANDEHIMVYAKLQPVLGELRHRLGSARCLCHLEQQILPDPHERPARMRPGRGQPIAAPAPRRAR